MELNLVNQKIAVIGFGSQANKVIKYLKKINISPKYIYLKKIKKKHGKLKNFTTSLKDIEKCNIIFICSPHNTHFFYIKKFLLKKNTYIFCEKPPVNNLRDLNYLKKLKPKNLYFNFNYRFTLIANILRNTRKYKLGNLLYGTIVLTHGLATKKNYYKSWRADRLNTPFGIVEILSVHFIDLMINIFGLSKVSFNNHKVLQKSKNFDTSCVSLLTNDKKSIVIFNSYTSPLVEKKLFIFKNGYIDQNERTIDIFGPRNTFDKNGRFKKPQKMCSIKIKPQQDFDNSFNNSMNYFLKSIKDEKPFNKKLFSDSIKSNESILSLTQN